jgi:hypothetical protein
MQDLDGSCAINQLANQPHAVGNPGRSAARFVRKKIRIHTVYTQNRVSKEAKKYIEGNVTVNFVVRHMIITTTIQSNPRSF